MSAHVSKAKTKTSNTRQQRSVSQKILSIFVRWEFVLLMLLLGVFVLNANLSPHFLRRVNLLNATFSFMERAIMALPMMLIIISGEIDISVGGIIALSATAMGLAAEAGASIPVMIAVALLTGLPAGLLNAFVVLRFNVPSIAFTIGSMSLFRGISWAILGNQALTAYFRAMSQIGQGTIGNTLIPVPLVLFIILATIFGVILSVLVTGYLRFGLSLVNVPSQVIGIITGLLLLLIGAIVLPGLFEKLSNRILVDKQRLPDPEPQGADAPAKSDRPDSTPPTPGPN